MEQILSELHSLLTAMSQEELSLVLATIRAYRNGLSQEDSLSSLQAALSVHRKSH